MRNLNKCSHITQAIIRVENCDPEALAYNEAGQMAAG